VGSRDTTPDPPVGGSNGGSAPSEPGRGSREERRGRLHNALHRNPATGIATKTIVTLIGSAVILAGLVMLVTPGPGLVALVVGLAILATEWAWAESLLASARRALERSREKAAAVDPATRRRVLLIWTLAVILVATALVILVRLYGWPPFVLQVWQWLQRRAGWLPDLPGA